MSAVLAAEYDSLPPGPVKSSNVADVRWNPTTGRLFVTFKDGKRYYYEGVPVGVYQGFMSAPSKGQYLFYVIRGKGTDSVYAYGTF